MYIQWCLLLLSLPVDWLPKSSDAVPRVGCYPPATAVTPQPNGLLLAYNWLNLLFGQGASLDCLQQAWGLWQQSSNSWDIAVGLFVRSIIR